MKKTTCKGSQKIKVPRPQIGQLFRDFSSFVAAAPLLSPFGLFLETSHFFRNFHILIFFFVGLLKRKVAALSASLNSHSFSPEKNAK